MMSAFFHFKHTLNGFFEQFYKVILILDNFFLKYNGTGVKVGQIDSPQIKVPSRSSALLGLDKRIIRGTV